MSTETTGPRTAPPRRPHEGQAEDNVVTLRGRVTATPQERELPSGARIVTVRLGVERASTAMTSGSQQRSDWVDCSAWTASTRRTLLRWSPGDEVEIGGALRRRFYRAGAGATSIVEIEVLTARRPRAR